MRVLNNVMFFDLKDMENDRSEGLKTLPVMLGKKGALNFLQALKRYFIHSISGGSLL